jgi:hypothetical protein
MKRTSFIRDTARSGGVAAVLTPLAIALCGKVEQGRAIAPVNAISHILWGDKAARRTRPSLKYTLAGLALNTAAVAGWAALYRALPKTVRSGIARSLVGGAAVAAVAYVTDYHVVPKRLTPGFEKRLSGASLLAVYATLAVSFGWGGLRKRRSARRTSRA